MMSLLYRLLALPLIIILLSTVPLGVPALANDALLVKGVEVDVSADSALSARNKAFAEARRKAYEHLAARNMPESDLENLNIPDDAVLASMVRDFEIENEKMTSRRYVGTFNVRFNSNVRRALSVQKQPAPTTGTHYVLGQEGSEFTPTHNATGQGAGQGTGLGASPHSTSSPYANERDIVYSPARSNLARTNIGRQPAYNAASNTAPASAHVQNTPVLVLPWYGVRGRQTIWGADNPWRAAWEGSANILKDTTMPVLLPVGDVDDVRDYAPPQPLSSQGDIKGLMRRYNVADAVIALAEPAEAGAIVVSLFRIENGSPVAMGRFGVDAGAGRDSLKQAVTRTVESLRAMPKNAPLQVAQPGQSVQTEQSGQMSDPYAPYQPVHQSGAYNAGANHAFEVAATQFTALARFSGLQQWVQMRNALSAIPGIRALDIQSISPAQAQVQFNYAGNSQSLADLLAQNGFQFVPLASGAASSVAGSSAPTHQLTQTRSF